MKYIKQSERVGLNPFIVNKPIEVVALPKQFAVKASADLTTARQKLKETHFLHDAQNKVSIFRYGKKEIFNVMFGMMSSRARDLFIYIMYAINKDEDYILLSASKVKSDIGMSGRTLTDAIRELRECNIICFKARSIYWVNPMYIFNGNRIDYYENLKEENVIIKNIINR